MDAQAQVAEPVERRSPTQTAMRSSAPSCSAPGCCSTPAWTVSTGSPPSTRASCTALDRLITASMVDQPAEVLSFPPVLAQVGVRQDRLPEVVP